MHRNDLSANDEAYNNRYLTFKTKTNSTKRAITDYDVVVRLEPNEPLGYVNRAAVRMDKGDFKGAIADYDEAIGLDPQNRVAPAR